MRRPLRLLRKTAVLAVGIPVLVVGIILIPLPGPGIVICLLALVILSFEFETAKRYRDSLLIKLKDIVAKSKQR